MKEVDAVIVNDKSPQNSKRSARAAPHSSGCKIGRSKYPPLLEELAGVDFDLDLTGFDAPEIDNYLNLDMPKVNVEETGSDIPPIGTEPVSAPGSIWGLGNHRIGCGSATI